MVLEYGFRARFAWLYSQHRLLPFLDVQFLHLQPHLWLFYGTSQGCVLQVGLHITGSCVASRPSHSVIVVLMFIHHISLVTYFGSLLYFHCRILTNGSH